MSATGQFPINRENPTLIQTNRGDYSNTWEKWKSSLFTFFVKRQINSLYCSNTVNGEKVWMNFGTRQGSAATTKDLGWKTIICREFRFLTRTRRSQTEFVGAIMFFLRKATLLVSKHWMWFLEFVTTYQTKIIYLLVQEFVFS